MSEVVLKGGPMDGRTMTIVGYGTKVALPAWEYGWTFRCGAPSGASGMYLRDGSWQDADRDVVLPYSCPECVELGEDDE